MNFSKAILLTATLLLALSCNPRPEAAEGFGEGNLYARGFSMQECEGYTKVTLRNPWDTLSTRAEYILIPRESPLPDSLPGGTLLRTPVRNVAVLTALYLSVLDELGSLDAVGGVCEPEYVTCPRGRLLVGEGVIADLGNSISPNAEKILNIGAEAILASPFENAGYGATEKLGITVIEAADYMEEHPLGRCEWLRFYGRLFGCQATADSLFAATVKRYNDLKALADTVSHRPKVLLEKRYGASWFIPAGNSFVATLHKDAGADYIFADHLKSNNIPLSSEAVFDRGQGADFWLFKYAGDQCYSRRQLLEEYPLYGGIKAFAEGSVLGCNTIRTTYYNDIALHPDRILEELIRIYHPQLLPEGELKYYRKLDE